MSKYVCAICGFVYDEAVGIPSAGIAAGTLWESLPDSWECPICGASKSAFKKQEEEKPAVAKPVAVVKDVKTEDLRQLSIGEVTALCSNLAKGCEKQYLQEETALFLQLAEYYKG
ncbi:MAG: rubredoxin, partial [Oscillospiraceae bacterium]